MADGGFALIRRGARGPAVVDLQRRLADAGHPTDDARGDFAAATEDAVRAFQSSHNLPVDGIVGPHTWSALVEAGWRLGDRVLYEQHPFLRGDDVADLQERLGSLGFDVGKVDGIFGPLARRAVTEFQRNIGATTDGIAGPATLRMLRNVGGAPAGAPSLAVRERLALRSTGTGVAGKRVFLDPRGGADDTGFVGDDGTCEADVTLELCMTLQRVLRDRGAVCMLSRDADEDPTGSERAALANWFGADVVVRVAVGSRAGVARASYFATQRYASPGGALLAELLTRRCAHVIGTTPEPPDPGLHPILRETRGIATVLEIRPPAGDDLGSLLPDSDTLHTPLASGIGTALGEFFEQQTQPLRPDR